MFEGKSIRPSEDAVFLRKEVIDASRRSDDKLESYSKRTDEKMDSFPQTITNSVGTQLGGVNSTMEKMKEEGEERYKQINERIANMEKKFSMIDEANEIKADDSSKVHEDQNHGGAVATGFHGDTSEQEIERLLRETITEIGMSHENARIECPAKPITHAFIHLKNNDERNKYVRSANMLRKELRERKIKITRSMDAEERFCQKRLGSVKCTIHTRHGIPLNSISLNWISKYLSVNGQIVVKNMSKWIPRVCQISRHRI